MPKPTRKEEPLYILVDMLNVAHMYFHALRDLKTGTGRSTGISYGTMELLRTLRREYDPAFFVFIADGANAKNFRRGIYPLYKQNRDLKKDRTAVEDPVLARAYEDVQERQLPALIKFLRGCGIATFGLDNLEADDVMAAAVRTCTQALTHRLLLVTSDTDLVQCVNGKRVRVYNPSTHMLYHQNEDGTLARNGEVIAPTPTAYMWRKVVVGDSADNIPGVRGIGKEFASRLFSVQPGKGDLFAYIEKNAHLVDALGPSRATTLRGARPVLLRNLILMDLCGAHHRAALRTIGYHSELDIRSSCRVTMLDEGCDLRRKSDGTYPYKTGPAYLRFPPNADPSPMRNAMRALEFQLPDWPTEFQAFNNACVREHARYADVLGTSTNQLFVHKT